VDNYEGSKGDMIIVSGGEKRERERERKREREKGKKGETGK
jgi:hypothetical protein